MSVDDWTDTRPLWQRALENKHKLVRSWLLAAAVEKAIQSASVPRLGKCGRCRKRLPAVRNAFVPASLCRCHLVRVAKDLTTASPSV
jgi:hypothetical protein